MSEINNLIFNDIEIEEEFRWLLEQRFAEKDVINIFKKHINFIPMDYESNSKIDLPAVTFNVFQSQSINADNEQIQQYTPFTVEIEVYTSGKNKVLNNKKLCNIIILILQSNGPLKDYYCRGLYLRENREVGTLLDSAYRRVIRMSGLCDNKQKLIMKGD